MDGLRVLKMGCCSTSEKPAGGDGHRCYPPGYAATMELKMQLPGPALPKPLLQSHRGPGICSLTSSPGNSDGVCLGASDSSPLQYSALDGF